VCIGKIKVCFHCEKQFEEAEICKQCGWLVCPHCGKCFHDLGEEGQRTAKAFEKQLRLNFA